MLWGGVCCPLWRCGANCVVVLVVQAIATEVWRLLEFLPDNKRIKTRVTTLDGTIALDTADADADAAAATAATTPAAVDWATLLPGGSVLQLLYTMQLVDERVGSAKTGAGSSAGGRNPQGSGDAASRDAEDAEHRRAWCDAFVEQGGFQHLYGCGLGY